MNKGKGCQNMWKTKKVRSLENIHMAVETDLFQERDERRDVGYSLN